MDDEKLRNVTRLLSLGKLLRDELEGMRASAEVGEKRARDDGAEDA